jgi:hypothetical protein
MSSYTPLAVMLPTNAHNPRGAAEATEHTHDVLPITAVLHVSSMSDLFDTASVVYDKDASSEADGDRAEDGVLGADGRRVDGVLAQDVVPHVRVQRGRGGIGVRGRGVVKPVVQGPPRQKGTPMVTLFSLKRPDIAVHFADMTLIAWC